MKRILLIILTLILVSLIPMQVLASDLVFYNLTDYHNSWNDNDYWNGFSFYTGTGFWIDSILFQRMGRWSSSETNGDITCRLETASQSTYLPTKTVLEEVVIPAATVNTWATVGEGSSSYSVTFAGTTYLSPATWYSFVWHAGNTYEALYQHDLTTVSNVKRVSGNNDTESSCTYSLHASNYPPNFRIYGVASSQSTVVTLDAESIYPSTARLPGLVTALGDETQLTVSIEYGFTTGNYDHETTEGTVSGTGINGYFFGEIYSPITDVTYFYRAKAVGENGTVYGEEKEFIFDSSIETVLETLGPSNIKFTSATVGLFLVNMGGDDTYELSIDLGTDGTYGTNTVIDADATEPIRLQATVTGLTEGTTYHYRAKAVGDETYYGEDKTFTTSNSAVTGIVNQGNILMGYIGMEKGGWWLILLLGIIASAYFLRKQPKIALAVSLGLIGLFLAIKAIDIWIVVILASIAIGAIVLVIKNRSQAQA